VHLDWGLSSEGVGYSTGNSLVWDASKGCGGVFDDDCITKAPFTYTILPVVKQVVKPV